MGMAFLMIQDYEDNLQTVPELKNFQRKLRYFFLIYAILYFAFFIFANGISQNQYVELIYVLVLNTLLGAMITFAIYNSTIWVINTLSNDELAKQYSQRLEVAHGYAELQMLSVPDEEHSKVKRNTSRDDSMSGRNSPDPSTSGGASFGIEFSESGQKTLSPMNAYPDSSDVVALNPSDRLMELKRRAVHYSGYNVHKGYNQSRQYRQFLLRLNYCLGVRVEGFSKKKRPNDGNNNGNGNNSNNKVNEKEKLDLIDILSYDPGFLWLIDILIKNKCAEALLSFVEFHQYKQYVKGLIDNRGKIASYGAKSIEAAVTDEDAKKSMQEQLQAAFGQLNMMAGVGIPNNNKNNNSNSDDKKEKEDKGKGEDVDESKLPKKPQPLQLSSLLKNKQKGKRGAEARKQWEMLTFAECVPQSWIIENGVDESEKRRYVHQISADNDLFQAKYKAYYLYEKYIAPHDAAYEVHTFLFVVLLAVMSCFFHWVQKKQKDCGGV